MKCKGPCQRELTRNDFYGREYGGYISWCDGGDE